MSATLPQPSRAGLLTRVESTKKPTAKVILTPREKSPRLVRKAISKSGLLLKEITDKDHGQASREIDAKEKLDFHEMVEKWPAEVWCELIPILALETCPGRFIVERTIAIKETVVTLKEKQA